MTLNEIRNMTKETLSPAIVAGVIGCDPHYIRLTAREAPEELPFPVITCRSRVRIPRLAFIRFMEGKEEIT